MRVCLAILSLCFVVACSPIGTLVGAGSTVGVSAMQERGFSQASKDAIIETQISHLLFKKHVDDAFRPVNVAVYEGRVLLTGSVPNADTMVDVVRISWSVDGVKEVINELSVSEDTSFFQDTKDAWIGARLKGKFTFDKNINAINYNIEVVNGMVYLIGIANSHKELEAVTNSTRTTGGVKRVISYIRVNDEIADPKQDPVAANTPHSATSPSPSPTLVEPTPKPAQ